MPTAPTTTLKALRLCLAAGRIISGFNIAVATVIVRAAMGIGGLLNARRVAFTMSKRITTMNDTQGLTANVVTSALVILATLQGLPVSTTHVSCGSLFGIGLITKRSVCEPSSKYCRRGLLLSLRPPSSALLRIRCFHESNRHWHSSRRLCASHSGAKFMAEFCIRPPLRCITLVVCAGSSRLSWLCALAQRIIDWRVSKHRGNKHGYERRP